MTDSFALPAGMAPGTYHLLVTVRDRDGYSPPLGLANQGRTAAGSYLLGDVTVR